MKKFTLNGQKRTELRRKVRKMRREGQIPATVYGNKVKSESLTIAASDFKHTYNEAGETGLVELSVDGKVRPVLIHHVQRDPVKGTILHVEFHQVDLKVKVKASVPLELVGESPAAAQKLGVVLTLLATLEVEALPAEIPEKIEVDISGLTEVDQESRVSDLTVPNGVTVVTDGSVSVVKIGALVSKAAEEQAKEEEEAAKEASPAEEGKEAVVTEETKTEASPTP